MVSVPLFVPLFSFLLSLAYWPSLYYNKNMENLELELIEILYLWSFGYGREYASDVSR